MILCFKILMVPRQFHIMENFTFLVIYVNLNLEKIVFKGGFDNQVNGTALNTVYHLVEYYWTDEFFWYVSEFTLQHPRYNHRTVIQGDIILHVGGPSFQNIEAWIYRPDVSDENEQKYLIRHTRFETYNWFSYPEVFVMKPSDVIQPA